MRKSLRLLAAMAAASVLAGCAGLDIFGARFDPNEYDHLVSINIDAQNLRKKCDNPSEVRAGIDPLIANINRFYVYTKYLPSNEETHSIARIMFDHTREFYQRYNSPIDPSKYYCDMKLKLLVKSTETALSATAKKTR